MLLLWLSFEVASATFQEVFRNHNLLKSILPSRPFMLKLILHTMKPIRTEQNSKGHIRLFFFFFLNFYCVYFQLLLCAWVGGGNKNRPFGPYSDVLGGTCTESGLIGSRSACPPAPPRLRATWLGVSNGVMPLLLASGGLSANSDSHGFALTKTLWLAPQSCLVHTYNCVPFRMTG